MYFGRGVHILKESSKRVSKPSSSCWEIFYNFFGQCMVFHYGDMLKPSTCIWFMKHYAMKMCGGMKIE